MTGYAPSEARVLMTTVPPVVAVPSTRTFVGCHKSKCDVKTTRYMKLSEDSILSTVQLRTFGQYNDSMAVSTADAGAVTGISSVVRSPYVILNVPPRLDRSGGAEEEVNLIS